MEKVITKDGSFTYYNKEFSEHYHSISGAKEEALKKFVLPSLKDYKIKNEIKILDICFGLGYNSAAAIDEIKKINNVKIKIIALENDKEILNKILENNIDFKNYDIIKKSIKNNYNDENVSIKMILGDALEEIKKLNEEFDFIFHDPFSTKKMPNFWTEDFFKEEFRLLKKNGRLTTYSCARLIRDNLKKAKFKTYDVAPVGRRAPSTLAVKPL
jgi:tRNA U34 5-methylaminomethyl-2-thiouridine-forming methyltransferase MnmC